MNAIKKAIFLGSMLAGASAMPSLAQSPYYKSGFLVGGHVGASFGSGTFKSTFTTGGGLVTVPSTGSARKTAYAFGLMGGYRQILNDGYTIGFNVEGNVYSKNEMNKIVSHSVANGMLNFNNRIKRSFDFIGNLSLGKIFNERYHASLGLGLAVANFKQQVDFIFSIPTDPVRASQTKLGLVPSATLEYAATKNISFVGNISYEIYKRVSKTFINPFRATSATYTSAISPRYLGIKVGAVYKF